MFCLTKGEINVHYAKYRLSVSCPTQQVFGDFPGFFLKKG